MSLVHAARGNPSLMGVLGGCETDSGFQIRNGLSILPLHITFLAMPNLTKRVLVMEISKETG